MNSGAGWRLGRRPALDGLRGVAVLLVIGSHAGLPGFGMAGAAGVACFFALSGFLITALLLEERERDRGGLRGFYVRRARRLLPALAVFVAGMLAVGLATPEQIPAVALYVQNFAVIAGGTAGALPHLWSLSVEEQFYLLWPIALLAAPRARWAVIVAALVAVISLGTRLGLYFHGADWGRIYFGSDTTACLLLVGCLAAFAARSGRHLPARMFWPAVAAVIALGAMSASRAGWTLVPIFAAVLAVVAVLAAAGPQEVRAPGWLRYVGLRSYALYLWHYPLVYLLPLMSPAPRWLTVTAGLLATWLAAELSWRLVERRFMRTGQLTASTFITAAPAKPPACVVPVPVPVRE